MLTKKPHLNDLSSILVTVNLVGDKKIQALNKKYRDKDIATDVLSFPIDEQSELDYILGDIVVNKDQAKRQATEYGNTLEEEIAELVAHGMLHLLGVHHDGDDH